MSEAGAAQTSASAGRLPWFGLLLVAGLLAVLALSLPQVEWAPPAAEPAEPAAFVARYRELRQRFVGEPAEMVALRLRLSPGQRGAGDLRLRLAYADGGDLALAALPAAAIPADGRVTIRFAGPIGPPPAPQLRRPAFELTISSDRPGAAPHLLLGPAGAGGPQLTVDEIARPGLALAVAPVYRIRPIELAWPIGRMAAGRPGLLGWPPLYALGPYGLGCALVVALRRAARL